MANFCSKLVKSVFLPIVESVLRNISGEIGIRLRRIYFNCTLGTTGKNLKVGIGVKIQGAEFIHVGDDVWIDDYCNLIAGKTGKMEDREVKTFANKDFVGEEGILQIGSNIHFAPNCLIHAYGGVFIGDYATFSRGVTLYSMSNHYQSFEDNSLITYSNPMVKNKRVVFFKSPIVIKENVFVSINAVILRGTIHENSYISPMSLVIKNIPKNSIATGNPATKTRNRFNLNA